jgi:hypothetical protein
MGISRVGLVVLACACTRSGGNRDSVAAADSTKPALAGATTAVADSTARAAAAADSTASKMAPAPGTATSTATGSPQRPSPRDTRPTPPSNPVNPPASAGVPDTARGTPAVVGTSFQQKVVLQRPGGGASIPLDGPQAKLIGAQSGADVWVEGTRDATGTLTVKRFVVRSVDGTAAIDGVLRADGTGLAVVTPDGASHALKSAPEALRQHVGHRVWVTGASSGPLVYGVIDKNP